MISKYVEFSIDEMMTPMQKKKKKKKKKNAGVFPIPADTKFRACALIKLWALSFCYHKMIFDITKSMFDITNLVCDTKKIDLMLG